MDTIPEFRFVVFCAERGRTATKMQRMVVKEVFALGGPFTADNLSATFAAKGVAVSRATVFRTLRILEEAEMVRRDGEVYSLRG